MPRKSSKPDHAVPSRSPLLDVQLPEVVNAQAADTRQRERVQVLSGLGLGAADIALVEAIPIERILRDYRTELARGPLLANVAVAQSLYRLAQGTNAAAVTAAWKWLCARAGWTEYAPGPARAPADDPAVAAESAEALGKKALRDLEAKTAEVGTSWQDLIH